MHHLRQASPLYWKQVQYAGRFQNQLLQFLLKIEAEYFNMYTSCLFQFNKSQCSENVSSVSVRVADVGGPRDRRSPKGQGLLRKEGPPTYAILSRNLVLSRFTRFLNGHHRAFYKSHPTLGVFSTKVSLLLKGFQQKSACFQRAHFQIAFVELS